MRLLSLEPPVGVHCRSLHVVPEPREVGGEVAARLPLEHVVPLLLLVDLAGEVLQHEERAQIELWVGVIDVQGGGAGCMCRGGGAGWRCRVEVHLGTAHH